MSAVSGVAIMATAPGGLPTGKLRAGASVDVSTTMRKDPGSATTARDSGMNGRGSATDVPKNVISPTSAASVAKTQPGRRAIRSKSATAPGAPVQGKHSAAATTVSTVT